MCFKWVDSTAVVMCQVKLTVGITVYFWKRSCWLILAQMNEVPGVKKQNARVNGIGNIS